MPRKRFARAFTLVFLLVVAGPMYAPPTFESGTTYYSDYFVDWTWVGAEAVDCSGNYGAWGTLDGPYKYRWLRNCETGVLHDWCYQKNTSGGWDLIPCP